MAGRRRRPCNTAVVVSSAFIPIGTAVIALSGVIGGHWWPAARRVTRHSFGRPSADVTLKSPASNAFGKQSSKPWKPHHALVLIREVTSKAMDDERRDHLLHEGMAAYIERLLQAQETLRILAYSQTSSELRDLHTEIDNLLRPVLSGEHASHWILSWAGHENPLRQCLERLGTANRNLVESYPTKPSK